MHRLTVRKGTAHRQELFDWLTTNLGPEGYKWWYWGAQYSSDSEEGLLHVFGIEIEEKDDPILTAWDLRWK